MIDHAHRCIFIHQRKAAGCSIISSFGLTPADQAWHRCNDGVLDKSWRRRTAEERRYFVFSAVRNPFDRLVSAWRYLESTKRRTLLEVLMDPPREGHDFRHLTRPQVALLRDPETGRLVTDDLIRYERLDEDFARIRETLGLAQAPLPALNRGERQRDYHFYFDDRTRALAAELFREDLDAFGYAY
jgi:hypothetical protein